MSQETIRLVMGNLRRNQAFDATLKSANVVDEVSAKFADAILYERNDSKRAQTIDKLVSQLIDATDKKILPQAQKIGTANAEAIISKTPIPKGFNLNDAEERGAALFRAKMKARDRLKIVKASVESNGKELDATLTKYWLEPSEGGDKEKLKRLEEIHNKMEKERKAWENDLKDFNAGERKTRPSQPKLDFMSEMTAESKKDIRVQARRTGTDTEIATFQNRGHKNFIWIAPNGIVACPDCINRKNVVLTIPEWESIGRPGSGKTVCGAHCFCMLLPVETAAYAPSLITARETVERGPSTSAAVLEFLNRNRVEKTSINGLVP